MSMNPREIPGFDGLALHPEDMIRVNRAIALCAHDGDIWAWMHVRSDDPLRNVVSITDALGWHQGNELLPWRRDREVQLLWRTDAVGYMAMMLGVKMQASAMRSAWRRITGSPIQATDVEMDDYVLGTCSMTRVFKVTQNDIAFFDNLPSDFDSVQQWREDDLDLATGISPTTPGIGFVQATLSGDRKRVRLASGDWADAHIAQTVPLTTRTKGRR